MPLSGTVAKPCIVELVQAIRRHPDAAYAVAIGLVALATLARWAMGDYGGGQIPFITFFPAIIIATLIGGLWPSVCAIILSVLSAWYLFIPPAFSFELGSRELVQLLWFILFLRHKPRYRCRRKRVGGPRYGARTRHAHSARMRTRRRCRGGRGGQHKARQCKHGETVRLQAIRTA